MNWKKWITRGALVGLSMLAITAQAFTLKVSAPTNNDGLRKWMDTFKTEVETESKGKITVELYPSNQLGQIPATVEGVMFGTIEITMPAAGFLVKVDPRFEVFDVPGLFSSFEEAQRVLSDPEILDHIAGYGSKSGVTTIGAFAHGPLGLLTVSGVRTVADINGKKIRVAGPTPLHVAPYKKMGAAPLSMPLGEVLPALQTGGIDGLLAGVPVYTTGKFYDVAKPITILPGSYLIVTAVASNAFLNRIGPELKAVVLEAARKALPIANEWNRGFLETTYATWKDNGGEIIEFSAQDRAAYLDAVEAIMPEVYNANKALKPEIEAFRAAAKRLAPQ